MTKPTSKIDQLILQLRSDKMTDALAAVKELKKHGNSKAIEPLLSTWIKNSENILGDAIEKLLHNLKDTEGAYLLINQAKTTTDEEIRPRILACLWNAGIDCSDHLLDLVNIAVNSEYLTAVECMTIIENMEGPFEETQIMESLISLRLALQQETDSKPIYQVLLQHLEEVERKQ